MWEKVKINIGKFNVNKAVTISFVYKGDISDIVSVTASCSCTEPKITSTGVQTTLRIKTFPQHLPEKPSIHIIKRLVVRYKDGSVEVLYIEGDLINNRL